MARPKKAPQDKRTKVVNIRFTEFELEQLNGLAQDAGMPTRRYIRETLLGRRPRAKPANTLLFQKLLYELQSIATNFQQLADALDDDSYLEWARYTGGTLVEMLIGRDDLSPLIEEQMDEINAAGHAVNALARRANSGAEISRDDRLDTLRAARLALEPLHLATEKPRKGKQREVVDMPADI